MFSKTDGPTALRADLVRSLSFSHDPIERLSSGASVASVAALAGVWNGRKGHVALLIRDIEPAGLERYVGDAPITSEAALDGAVEEGLAFAETLGFSMDAPEFITLTSEARDERIYRWNKLRKLRRGATTQQGLEAPSAPDLDIPEPPEVPRGYEIGPNDLSVPAPSLAPDLPVDLYESDAPALVEPVSPSQVANAASTVLGRISLVRKDGNDARRLELLARLLAFY
ncbi:MAG: hypothetical protein ACREBE_22100 [bacterium]